MKKTTDYQSPRCRAVDLEQEKDFCATRNFEDFTVDDGSNYFDDEE